MSLLADMASAVLIIAGAAFFLIGAVGILRMPDVFTRLHAASLAETTGMVLIVAGLVLQAGASLAAVKLVVLLAILLVMGPASTHALASAALAAGIRPFGKGAAPPVRQPSASAPRKGPARRKGRG